MSTLPFTPYLGGHARPLKWRKAGDRVWYACLKVRGLKHEITLFEVVAMSDGTDHVLVGHYRKGSNGTSSFPSLAEAKAAAQTEWENLLRASIKGS